MFDFRSSFQLNTLIEDLELQFNILFLGTNIRTESPLLNIRLRKAFLASNFFNVYSIGSSSKFLTYPVKNLGIHLYLY